MKHVTIRRKRPSQRSVAIRQRLKEGAFILLCSIGIYLFIGFATYHASDPSWSHATSTMAVQNAAGKTGAWLSDIFFMLFGQIAYIFPLGLLVSAFFVYRDPVQEEPHSWLWPLRVLGFTAALGASCGLTSLIFSRPTQLLHGNAGGLLGEVIHSSTVSTFSTWGAGVLLLAFLLAGITLFTGFSWLNLARRCGLWLFERAKQRWMRFEVPDFSLPALWEALPRLLPPTQSENGADKVMNTVRGRSVIAKGDFLENLPIIKKAPPPTVTRQQISKPPTNVATQLKKARATVSSSSNVLPSLSLLDVTDKAVGEGYSEKELLDLSRLVETRLLEFGVDAKVVGVYPGPVITRFELDLAAGIKVNKITGLAKDLARSLSVVSVRVVEVIPGKSVVGLEIPNAHREIVRLKELLEDTIYQRASSPLTLALGKDISGRPVVVDLAKMPHLLVAGTTGSGKSVGLNAMLLSLLYKSTPDDIRLILIDPKMLELAVYDNIPHLLTPVVTDMKEAANALRWCVAEMERRYQLMAALGVRNLAGYNDKVTRAQKAGEPLLDPLWEPSHSQSPEPLEAFPYVVVVVDEFADMMMVVGKKVEELIARIAQKARAAGIHLILATQRPSVDVITGLIKANIPTRIAFQVSSRIDSRTILDQSGAEQLLGHGDMLYLPPGVGVPHRIHGAFVSDEEVHNVANECRKLGKPQYIESVLQSSSSSMVASEEVDELYDQAIMVVTQERKASISLVQRRLKIGYNRAARLIEQMQAEGVVSDVQSNGLREVLAPPPVES